METIRETLERIKGRIDRRIAGCGEFKMSPEKTCIYEAGLLAARNEVEREIMREKAKGEGHE